MNKFLFLKTVLKKANLAIENQDENCAEAVRLATKKIDQAATRGIIHKNAAAHKKSQFTIKLNKMA